MSEEGLLLMWRSEAGQQRARADTAAVELARVRAQLEAVREWAALPWKPRRELQAILGVPVHMAGSSDTGHDEEQP